MTPRGARFWVRTLRESEIEVRVSARGDFEKADARGSTRTRAGEDYTGVVRVDGLQPATRYRYELWIEGRPLARGEFWEFLTFPKDDTKQIVRLAFGGCAKFLPENSSPKTNASGIRSGFAGRTPFLGDNVYTDLPESVGPLHDYTYYQRQSRPEFRRLTATVPTFAIWDDHDAGIDDVFLGPYADKPRWKVGHLELFRAIGTIPPMALRPSGRESGIGSAPARWSALCSTVVTTVKIF